MYNCSFVIFLAFLYCIIVCFYVLYYDVLLDDDFSSSYISRCNIVTLSLPFDLGLLATLCE